MTGAERFLAACRGDPVDATPVWFMRQAGGQLPAYLALRERHSVMDIATTPSLCAEVSIGAVDALGVDGAVLYADIMLLVQAMGVAVELRSDGPVIDRPIRTLTAVESLRLVDVASDLGFVLEAIGLVRAGLAGRAAVIGICGGPFTLGAYLVEGSPSRDQVVARSLILREPGTWQALMERLTTATIDYARAQVAAGADVIAVFDTWAASLTATEYRVHVAPWTRRILRSIADAGVPSIHSVARSGPILDELLATRPTVVAIDSRQHLAQARQQLGAGAGRPGQSRPGARARGLGACPRRGAGRSSTRSPVRPGTSSIPARRCHATSEPGVLRDLVSFIHDRTAGIGRPNQELIRA